MTKRRSDLLHAIDSERKRQDKKWGGPRHDDQHSDEDWARYRGKFARRLRAARSRADKVTALVRIAALCVAQAESIMRR